MRYKVGQKVVYPGHGVSTIKRIDTRRVAGQDLRILVLNTWVSGMTVMIPVKYAKHVGIRETISEKDIPRVERAIGQSFENGVSETSWNRRYRVYAEKIKTGSVWETAEVLGKLQKLELSKDLSFGEQKMKAQAKDLIKMEFAAARGLDNADDECDVGPPQKIL